MPPNKRIKFDPEHPSTSQPETSSNNKSSIVLDDCNNCSQPTNEHLKLISVIEDVIICLIKSN